MEAGPPFEGPGGQPDVGNLDFPIPENPVGGPPSATPPTNDAPSRPLPAPPSRPNLGFAKETENFHDILPPGVQTTSKSPSRSCFSNHYYGFHPSAWHHLADLMILAQAICQGLALSMPYYMDPKYIYKIDEISIQPFMPRSQLEVRKVFLGRIFIDTAFGFGLLQFTFLLGAHSFFFVTREHLRRGSCLGVEALHARNLVKWAGLIAGILGLAGAGLLIDSKRLGPVITLNWTSISLEIAAGAMSFVSFYILLNADGHGICGRRKKSEDVESRGHSPLVKNVADEMLGPPDAQAPN